MFNVYQPVTANPLKVTRKKARKHIRESFTFRHCLHYKFSYKSLQVSCTFVIKIITYYTQYTRRILDILFIWGNLDHDAVIQFENKKQCFL